MAVGFSNTNKPINPRGQDASPLAYNRAKLYSGKALDFDGVNDFIDISAIDETIIQSAFSFHTIIKKENNATDNDRIIDITIDSNNAFNLITDNSSQKYAVYLKISGTNEVNQLTYSSIVFDELAAITFTWDGSNGAFYYNGQLVESTGSAVIGFGTAGAFLGKRTDAVASTFFNGLMSGSRLFSTALTAAQVADLYNNPEKIVPTGVEDTALKLWLPMMEGAGTKCLDGASLHTATERVENGDFSDGTTGWVGNPQTTLSVTNGQLDIQSAGTGYGAAFTEVNFVSGKYYLIQLDVVSCDVPTQIRIGSKNDPTLYATNIWSSGEIGIGSHSTIWYATTNDTYLAIGGRDDVDTLVIDNVSVKEVSVGNISGATWTHGIGSPVAQTSVIDWNKRILDKTNEFLIPQGLTAGRDLLGNLFENVRKQGALNLDGNSWAEVHDNASVDITDAITLEAWVYWDTSILTGKGILGKWENSNQCYLLFKRNTGTELQFYINGAYSVFDPMVDGWNHIVGTYDKVNRKLYVNGELKDTDAFTASIATSALPVEIGRYNQSSAVAYDEDIAQPRIYNRALTAAEVLRNYNSGKNTYK